MMDAVGYFAANPGIAVGAIAAGAAARRSRWPTWVCCLSCVLLTAVGIFLGVLT